MLPAYDHIYAKLQNFIELSLNLTNFLRNNPSPHLRLLQTYLWHIIE